MMKLRIETALLVAFAVVVVVVVDDAIVKGCQQRPTLLLHQAAALAFASAEIVEIVATAGRQLLADSAVMMH